MWARRWGQWRESRGGSYLGQGWIGTTAGARAEIWFNEIAKSLAHHASGDTSLETTQGSARSFFPRNVTIKMLASAASGTLRCSVPASDDKRSLAGFRQGPLCRTSKRATFRSTSWRPQHLRLICVPCRREALSASFWCRL
jgi:hypothetical protein